MPSLVIALSGLIAFVVLKVVQAHLESASIPSANFLLAGLMFVGGSAWWFLIDRNGRNRRRSKRR